MQSKHVPFITTLKTSSRKLTIAYPYLIGTVEVSQQIFWVVKMPRSRSHSRGTGLMSFGSIETKLCQPRHVLWAKHQNYNYGSAAKVNTNRCFAKCTGLSAIIWRKQICANRENAQKRHLYRHEFFSFLFTCISAISVQYIIVHKMGRDFLGVLSNHPFWAGMCHPLTLWALRFSMTQFYTFFRNRRSFTNFKQITWLRKTNTSLTQAMNFFISTSEEFVMNIRFRTLSKVRMFPSFELFFKIRILQTKVRSTLFCLCSQVRYIHSTKMLSEMNFLQ